MNSFHWKHGPKPALTSASKGLIFSFSFFYLRIYCKSTIFGRYKIWWIYNILSDNRSFSLYISLFNFCLHAKSAKLNSTPNLVDLQLLIGTMAPILQLPPPLSNYMYLKKYSIYP